MISREDSVRQQAGLGRYRLSIGMMQTHGLTSMTPPRWRPWQNPWMTMSGKSDAMPGYRGHGSRLLRRSFRKKRCDTHGKLYGNG